MADKTPVQVADEISEIFIDRLSQQLVPFNKDEAKAEIAQFENFGAFVINTFLHDKKMNKEFENSSDSRYRAVASMAFQAGGLFEFMYKKEPFTLMSGEYPAVVAEEGTMKFFETIWNGSSIEDFGKFVNSMSGYWLQLMEQYLQGEEKEEYAEAALMAFFRSGATCFFAWMQK